MRRVHAWIMDYDFGSVLVHGYGVSITWQTQIVRATVGTETAEQVVLFGLPWRYLRV